MTPIKPMLGAAFAALSIAAAAQAAARTNGATETEWLIVAGEAQVEHAPDWAVLGVTLRGEGKTQADAVAAMSALRARLEGDLARLPGSPVVGLASGALDVDVVRGKDCGGPDDAPMPERPVLSQGACAVIGAVATLDLQLKISPATALSEGAAHAVADGADRPHIEGTGVTDMDALNRDAMRQALANAQAKAETIAAASGRRLGAIDSHPGHGQPASSMKSCPGAPTPITTRPFRSAWRSYRRRRRCRSRRLRSRPKRRFR